MSSIRAIFVPSPLKTGTKLLHPLPPQSLNGSVISKRAVPTRVNIIALAAELGVEVAVAGDLSISLSLSNHGLLILLSSGEQ